MTRSAESRARAMSRRTKKLRERTCGIAAFTRRTPCNQAKRRNKRKGAVAGRRGKNAVGNFAKLPKHVNSKTVWACRARERGKIARTQEIVGGGKQTRKTRQSRWGAEQQKADTQDTGERERRSGGKKHSDARAGGFGGRRALRRASSCFVVVGGVGVGEACACLERRRWRVG